MTEEPTGVSEKYWRVDCTKTSEAYYYIKAETREEAKEEADRAWRESRSEIFDGFDSDYDYDVHTLATNPTPYDSVWDPQEGWTSV